MFDWLQFGWMGLAALAAAFLSSVAGAGLSAVLLPVVVLFVGIHEAVPIVSIALLSAGISRVAVNWREVRLHVVGWYVLGALPMAVAGTLLFTVTPPGILVRLLGALLLATVVWRRVNPRPPVQRSAVWFLPVGLVLGFLTGIMQGMGPMMAPFFLAYGLRKGAYVGTAGLVALTLQATKIVVFGRTDFLTPLVVAYGLALVPIVVAGTVLGKRVMNRLSPRMFEHVIEVLMVVTGIGFLFNV